MGSARILARFIAHLHPHPQQAKSLRAVENLASLEATSQAKKWKKTQSKSKKKCYLQSHLPPPTLVQAVALEGTDGAGPSTTKKRRRTGKGTKKSGNELLTALALGNISS
jgi:hypothetical protein